ncbi:MAG: hypothetical protein J2P25_22045, partial [Nocardiopsaceae bacterium]|nr:hypothetical protein [Nocardiopsaceae bacterium]
MANGEVPPDGTAGGAPDGGSGRGASEEAAWLDLVARFAAPADGDGVAPWPEREDLAESVPAAPAVPDALSTEPPANGHGLA